MIAASPTVSRSTPAACTSAAGVASLLSYDAWSEDRAPVIAVPLIAAGPDDLLILELRKGLGIWGASEAGDPLLSRAEGQPDFVSARLGLGTRWSVNPALRATPFLAINGAAQWSNAPLPSYEEFQVGNYTIGRGFDPGAASGDSAVAGQFEAGWEFRGAMGSASVFAFFDAAHLRNRDAFSTDTTVRSNGVGARAFTRCAPNRSASR